MASVFKIQADNGNSIFTVYATENGKILQTNLEYWSGLSGHTIYDNCVDVSEDQFGRDTSGAELFWLDEEFVKENLSSAELKIEECDYKGEFDEPQPTISKIGDRVVLTPHDLICRALYE